MLIRKQEGQNKGRFKDRSRDQRESATLLVLKMEEGAPCQGVRAASSLEAGGGKEMDPS